MDRLVTTISALAAPRQYPAACLLSPDLELAQELDRLLLSKLPRAAISEEVHSEIEVIQNFIRNAKNLRDQATSKFEERQLPLWEGFFDTFESNPLTPEQRTSIIADEDATLVLAGACPSCDDGWLVERKGRYGRFLGCVRFPACKGKKKTS